MNILFIIKVKILVVIDETACVALANQLWNINKKTDQKSDFPLFIYGH